LTSLSGEFNKVKEKVDKLKNTTYTFSTGKTTDGSIHITSSNDPEGSESVDTDIQVKGWEALVNNVNGRNTAYVYENRNDPKYIADIKTLRKYRLGDLIFFKDANIEDQWVTEIYESPNESGIYYEFTELALDVPSLDGYLTS
jgi:hypothetical protein